jgi:hypothetical protein
MFIKWLELGLYSVIVLLIFIGMGLTSCFIYNNILHRKNKLKEKRKKKSYFIDVA